MVLAADAIGVTQLPWANTTVTSGVNHVVCFNNNFMAWNDGGSTSSYYSTDGVNWSSGSPSTTNRLWSCTYGNGYWLLAGSQGTGSIQVSTNGTSWTSYSTPSYTYLCTYLVSSNEFILITDNGTYYRSGNPSSSSWTQRANSRPYKNPSTGSFRGIATNGSTIVVCGGSGAYLWWSTDGGSNWSETTFIEGGSTNAGELYDVTWDGTQFIAVGGYYKDYSKSYFYTSPNGVTWSPLVAGSFGTPSLNTTLYSVGYGGGRYIVREGSAGYNLYNDIKTPFTKWSYDSSIGSSYGPSVAYSPNLKRWVAVKGSTLITAPNTR